jgi:hypothetical protein
MALPWQLQRAKYLLFVSQPFCAHFRGQIYSAKELIAVVLHGVAWVGGGVYEFVSKQSKIRFASGSEKNILIACVRFQ